MPPSAPVPQAAPMRNVSELQRELIRLGFLSPTQPDGTRSDDGKAGQLTFAAFNRFLASKGKPPVDPSDFTLTAINAALWPDEVPAVVPRSNPITDLLNRLSGKGPNIMSNWFNSFVTTTAFKYLVAMAATYIATRLGLDKGSVEGILTQLIGVIMAAWGAWEASRSKIVVNGTKVSFSALPASDKATVASIVADNK